MLVAQSSLRQLPRFIYNSGPDAPPDDILSSPQDTKFVLAPNGSLSVRGAWIFMSLAILGTGGLAGYCAWLGFWPVVPFAGLELGLLSWALRHSMQRSRYREVVTVCQNTVLIEYGMQGAGAGSCVEMPRHWTRAVLEEGAHSTRLVLQSSGNRVRIGQFLTDEERKGLAARLQCALRLPPLQQNVEIAAGKTLGDG